MTDQEMLVLARRVCTPKQVEALEKLVAGYGYRRIARQLRISPQAVAARVEAARRRLQTHLDEERMTG